MDAEDTPAPSTSARSDRAGSRSSRCGAGRKAFAKSSANAAPSRSRPWGRVLVAVSDLMLSSRVVEGLKSGGHEPVLKPSIPARGPGRCGASRLRPGCRRRRRGGCPRPADPRLLFAYRCRDTQARPRGRLRNGRAAIAHGQGIAVAGRWPDRHLIPNGRPRPAEPPNGKTSARIVYIDSRQAFRKIRNVGQLPREV